MCVCVYVIFWLILYIHIFFKAHKYHSRHEFVRDIEQILENCTIYNGKESPYTHKAELLVKVCKETLDEVRLRKIEMFSLYFVNTYPLYFMVRYLDTVKLIKTYIAVWRASNSIRKQYIVGTKKSNGTSRYRFFVARSRWRKLYYSGAWIQRGKNFYDSNLIWY